MEDVKNIYGAYDATIVDHFDITKMVHPKTHTGQVLGPDGKLSDTIKQIFYNQTDLKQGCIVGRFVNSALDLEAEKNRVVPMIDIFNTWNRFRVDGNPATEVDELKAWFYDDVSDQINCLVNSTGYIGFTSPMKSDDYVHTVTLSAPNRPGGLNGDDDVIGVILATHMDEQGRFHNLSAIRTPNVNQLIFLEITGEFSRWQIVYNMCGIDFPTVFKPKTIVNGNSAIDPTKVGAWNNFPNGTTVEIDRKGNIFKCTTSQMNETTLDPATTITFDLESDPDLHKFMGPQVYGYSCLSQDSSRFTNISFLERSPIIIDISTNAVYTFDGINWIIKSGISAESFIGIGKFLYNPNARKFYYYQDRTNSFEIRL